MISKELEGQVNDDMMIDLPDHDDLSPAVHIGDQIIQCQITNASLHSSNIISLTVLLKKMNIQCMLDKLMHVKEVSVHMGDQTLMTCSTFDVMSSVEGSCSMMLSSQ